MAVGGEKIDWDVWITGGDTSGDSQAGVFRRACAEEDFVFRAVLLEEGFEVGFQARLRSMQRLEKRERRGEPGAVAHPGQCEATLLQIAGNGPKHNGRKAGGGKQADDGQG